MKPDPVIEDERPEMSDAAVVSRSWGMALATLVSRITGFARIVLLAAILGAALSSAFTVANQLPNLIAALVLEATFTAIFVPVLTRAEREDSDGGAAFVRRLMTLATTVLAVATVLSVAGAPVLVRLMLGNDPQVNQPLTTAFAYLLLPQVIFYGLSSVFMAILNNRNIFGAPAWAPVINNVVAIATLGVYLAVPGQLSVDPVEMGNAKLLVLGIGTTLGVVAQAAVLYFAIRAQKISLRPLWGIDERLKRFGAMAGAMVLYVLISQAGLIVGNQIASTAAASGPAIYTYAWLVLMLPFGIIGVTVLTVVMPRLSRNAAAEDIPAVLADLSLATRLTMVTLIPVVALMTVGGPAIGSALFAYGKFGEVDANYLGIAIALSSFTLIPYALVLLQLRVFYAREHPWTPILIIVVITAVKIGASILAPHLTDDRELVAGYLGLANGIGFAAGAVMGHVLLRRSLRPPRGGLLDAAVIRTIMVTTAASLLAGLAAYAADRLLGLESLTARGGGAGSLLRLAVIGVIMLPVLCGVLLAGRVPDAVAARDALARRLRRPTPTGVSTASAGPRPHDPTLRPNPVIYPEQRNLPATGRATQKGPEVNDHPSGSDCTPLVPGATLAGGRFRLLTLHGGPPGLEFWQGMDTALDRQVALTVVNADGTLTTAEVEEILERTSPLSRINRPGIARVLDITDTPTGGLVVSEWLRGGSLTEVAHTRPSPIGGARAIQSLTAAAEAAHQAGVALSVDHAARIRVSMQGDVALAFPATLPGATPEDDIRGIGAALYALLVDRWPLPETGTPSGLAPAERDAAGNPVEPRALDRQIPFQISAAAIHSAQNDGIRSAPTLLNLLKQATAQADRTEIMEPADAAPPAAPPPPRAVRQPEPQPDPLPNHQPDSRPTAAGRRRRNLLIGLGAAGAILLVTGIVLATVLGHIFGNVSGLKGDQLGLNPSTSGDAAAAGSTVKPTTATVFSPGGGPDAPTLARQAIDGSSKGWPTDTYSDPVPFPSFKNGVGLMLQLPQPTTVGAVTVTVPSTGTQIQIRSATTPNPATLDDTKVLAGPTTLKQGENTIQVPDAAPTSNLLVWISTLGTTDGESRTELSKITVKAAS